MSSAISSADSATSAKSSQSPPGIPPAAPSLPPPSPAIKRRPTITDDRKLSSQSSPRKPQRSGSLASRKPRERRQTVDRGKDDECTDPNCTECIPAPHPRGRKPNPSLLASAFDDAYHAPSFDQRSMRSDPAPATSYISSPQSPTYTRPAPFMQGSAVLVPAQSTRRRSSSTTRAARPLSYHGGDPGSYWAPSPMQAPQYSSPQDLRGPPPSMSAHFSMHPPMPSYMAPPPQPNYYTRPMQQQAPQYDAPSQRPQMQSRTSSTYNTRGYGPTVITQETTGSIPSARYPSTQTGRQEPLVQTQYDTESSEYTSSEEEEQELYNPRVDRSRAIMPPPPPPPAVKKSTQRRPSLRHAATTQVYNSDRRMSQSQTLPVRPREPDPRDHSTRGGTAAPSRASSVARPALVQHPKAQSAFESTRNAKVVVENTKSQRRQSYQGYEHQYEEKERRRANRNSRVYGDDEIHAPKTFVVDEDKERRRANRSSKVFADDEIHASKVFAAAERERKRNSRIYADDAIQNPKIYAQDAIVPTRRRQTDSDLRRREEQIVETKNLRAAQDAEAYQRSMRGSVDPLTEKIHKAAKRASRVASGPSHAESSHSNGSDKASRVSHRTTATNGNSGEIRLRVDASAPLSLQFNGDMDGRTVHIEPMEDGMADIVIGNPGSRPDNVYRSEKGSLLGPSKTPKAIMAANHSRWEAEEVSVRSERAGRREGERRVLQRRRRDHE